MTTALITGANGFIGRHLSLGLEADDTVERVLTITREDTAESIADKLGRADVVYHLAGVNRPERTSEFREVNAGLTERIVRCLAEAGKTPLLVFASSTQAELDNEYGRSKREAEEILARWADRHAANVVISRLTNVFGKWARPGYNSVVATFCHNIARGRPTDVHDGQSLLRLVHVDDVVRSFLAAADMLPDGGVRGVTVSPVYELTVADLARRLGAFGDSRRTLRMPDLDDRLDRLLYGTFVSYLPTSDLAYDLLERIDDRGKLGELLKSRHFGQIFVSTTRPGVTRGQHFHHSKAEKFCVLSGEAVIRLRRAGDDEVHEYAVSGSRLRVVDIPPGYAHNIENVGDDEMIVLFWASEEFDPDRPDTYSLRVES